jgi:hypothetical protein
MNIARQDCERLVVIDYTAFEPFSVRCLSCSLRVMVAVRPQFRIN